MPVNRSSSQTFNVMVLYTCGMLKYVVAFMLLASIGIGAWHVIRSSPPIAENNATVPSMANDFSLTSSTFQNDASIPKKYTCQGDNMSPPLLWSGAPAGTKAFALLVDDPDVPKALKPEGVFDHWTLYNIPASATSIAEGRSLGTRGANGAGKNEYTGPCPPKHYEPSEHRYFFRLYALDANLNLSEGASKDDVLRTMQGHIIGHVELMGRYKQE